MISNIQGNSKVGSMWFIMLIYTKNGNIFPKKDGIPVIKKYSKVPIFPFLRGGEGRFEIMSLIFVPQSPKCMCSLKVNQNVVHDRRKVR